MIMLPSTVRIFLCTRPTDMRKSFDGLSGLVQECFGQDLLTGHLFLFVNRRRDRIKILYFDRDGLAIWYKRLEAGTFQMPATAEPDGIELQPAQLAMILSGIDLQECAAAQAVPRRLLRPGNPGKSASTHLPIMKTSTIIHGMSVTPHPPRRSRGMPSGCSSTCSAATTSCGGRPRTPGAGRDAQNSRRRPAPHR